MHWAQCTHRCRSAPPHILSSSGHLPFFPGCVATPAMAHTPAAAIIASYSNISNCLRLPWDKDWAEVHTPLCQLCGSCSRSDVQGQPDATPQRLVFLASGCLAGWGPAAGKWGRLDTLQGRQAFTREPEDGNMPADKCRPVFFHGRLLWEAMDPRDHWADAPHAFLRK